MKIFVSLIVLASSLSAGLYHFDQKRVWQEDSVDPFDEMIISWCAPRQGKKGAYHIYARVKTDEWSPWFLYATWASTWQSSYQKEEEGICVYQDALEVIKNKKATGFALKIETEGEMREDDISSLYIYTNSPEFSTLVFEEKESICLPVPRSSQVILNHPRNMSLCSPTATASVISYLTGRRIDPLLFAHAVWDQGFDIYGNWVFNAAEASQLLRGWGDCYVQRLADFETIYKQLKKNIPVVVSVRGPLPGSAAPYASGHLLVVRGYDKESESVLCMDPAFGSNEETYVSYQLADFLAAWKRRGYIAYIFTPKDKKKT